VAVNLVALESRPEWRVQERHARKIHDKKGDALTQESFEQLPHCGHRYEVCLACEPQDLTSGMSFLFT